MRKNLASLASVFAVVVALAIPVPDVFGQALKIPRQAESVSGEIIVKYRNTGMGRPAIEGAVAEDVYRRAGVKRLDTALMLGVDRVTPVGVSVDGALERLRSDSRVLTANKNYVVYPLDTTPNDPQWNKQWNLKKIGLPSLWDKTKGGSGQVVVAILDSGLDVAHQDLRDNLWKNSKPASYKDINGVSFCSDLSTPGNPRALGPSGDVKDTQGHGTHVAGTIGARGNNAKDVAGVTWNVQLMPIKFLCAGRGTIFDAIRAIQYAIDHNAHIINNSWGCYCPPNDVQALKASIEDAGTAGILFVAAAGNDGLDIGDSPLIPGAIDLPNTITVGATGKSDELAAFQNGGSSNWSKSLVQIAAPGLDIWSTVPGNGIESKEGTSMATPHVVGCAALLKALVSSRKAVDLKRLILAGADKINGLIESIEGGRRLNCAAAAAGS